MTEHTTVHVHDYRRWAVLGMVGGAVTSVAANVAHVFVPPVGAVHGWQPETGAVLASVIWPLALLAASEVLARKRWASTVTRVLGAVSVLVVATVAAVISYQHLYALLLHYGESELSARIGPLGIDGLMLVCSVALVAADAQLSPVTLPCTDTASTPDTAPSTPVPDQPSTGVTTWTGTANTFTIEHADTSAPPVAAASTRRSAVTEACTDTASTPELVDAQRLRDTDTRTLRGAMAELGCGQARARRVLALAWPTQE